MGRTYNISSNDEKMQESTTPSENPGFFDRIKKRWYIVPIVLGVGVLVTGGIFTVTKLSEHNEDVEITRTWDDIREVADGSTEDSSDSDMERTKMYSSDPMEREIDWDAILAVNSDIACWIYIPNTDVDYPVLQVSDWADNNYYLDHDVYKNSSSAGALYMPAPVEGFEETDMHQIIIGHHMRNGSMFSSLVNYKEKSYWEAAPTIYLYYPDRTEKWTIYSTYHVNQADSIYNMPYEAGTALYKELLDKIETSKLYDTGTNGPTVDAKLLTLTTCDRNSTEGADGRFVVNAKLVDTKSAGSDAAGTSASNVDQSVTSFDDDTQMPQTSTESEDVEDSDVVIYQNDVSDDASEEESE